MSCLVWWEVINVRKTMEFGIREMGSVCISVLNMEVRVVLLERAL